MKILPRLVSLRMWQKLAALALASGVPALLLAGAYVSAVTEDGTFLKKELDGLEYVEGLNKLVTHVPAHLSATVGGLHGDAAAKAFFAPKAADRRGRIDDAIRQADAADAKYGAKFGTSAKWAQVKADWAALRERAADATAEDATARHAKLLADVLAIEVEIGEKSNLILDPILITYYLQDDVTSRAPALMDYVSEARAQAETLAARREVTEADKFKLAGVLGQVSAARAGFDGNVTALGEKDSKIGERLAPRHAEAAAALDAFAALLQKRIIEAPADGEGRVALTVPPQEVWQKGTAAIEGYGRVNDEGIPILRELLSARYADENRQLYVTVALTSAALLLAMALVFLIARGITRQTRAIAGVLAQVGVGNLSARVAVVARDELGEVAAALNAMLDNTTALMQSQDERDRTQASIGKLLDEMSGVADGDLTQEAEVTADVTGAIADSFNYMLDQLRQIIGNVQRTTRQVTGSAAEIYASTRDLAGGAEQQAEQIGLTSLAVEEMAGSIRQVSANAVQSAAVAQQSLRNARQGNDAVKDTIAGMERIRDQVQETAKRMKRLGESSQEIGAIVQLIDDIADRTGILALNASIQAAMAGDAGRGFAVVAEEVERLAVRSTDATKKIATLVKTIQSETNEAVGAMEKGIAEVVAGSKLAAQAGQSLHEIEGVSGKLADLIQQISHASTKQSQASDGVTRAMLDISGVTRQTAAGTQQAADAVRSLSGLAEELQASVAAFKMPGAAPVVVAPSAPAKGRGPAKPTTLAARF